MIALSASAADILGNPEERVLGAEIAALTTSPESSKTALDVLASGAIDRYQAVRQIPRPDGSVVEVNLVVHDLAHIGFERRAIALLAAIDTLPGTEREGTADSDIIDLMQRLAAEQLHPDTAAGRVAELESGIERISTEIDALGVRTAEERRRTAAMAELTAREREVVQRLLRGERVPAIARALYLSQSTVRNHLFSVYRKMGVHSQVELIERLG